ncbi:hypothetical protein CRE_30445 [Caenorhabditis remanei]|uniref:Uncharacterized protein n=1 Tax=Caenorhabditis remanei TaxID=31234 RepID=E3NDZ1_CAERE|nr:hypothetical protein CRE_30445 [Caenorhabditis remanei]
MRAQKRCHGKNMENVASKLQKIDHSLDTTMDAETKKGATAINNGMSLDTMVREELHKSDESLCTVAESVMKRLSEIFARGDKKLLYKWNTDLEEIMLSMRTTLFQIRSEDLNRHAQVSQTIVPPEATEPSSKPKYGPKSNHLEPE